MPLVVPTTYNEAFKNTCPEKRTVTQTHAFTVKVRMRVCLECFLHPGARSANPWGKYGCKRPCSWGAFLPNSGSLSLLLGRISWNSRFWSLLLECISRSGVCGDIVVGCVGNYSPKFCLCGIIQKLFKKYSQSSKIFIQKLLKNIPLISTLPEVTRRDGGAPASN